MIHSNLQFIKLLVPLDIDAIRNSFVIFLQPIKVVLIYTLYIYFYTLIYFYLIFNIK